ncbi:hypothetical protein SAMN04489710_11832 [Paracidovorax konjaci]|uniref:Uncharacterized protein n=1 Tax=Paracidovorax konjaci TaxID=32040 RepID=A0A1I1YJZ8_9BURK|nr:hypothetical protein SAMN04489710_11832 [Paracidovorax konjaci]
MRLGYSEEFEAAWAAYPSRSGHSKHEAFKAWQARLKSGHTAADMHAGIVRYAGYVKACGTEQQYVKHAATFLGPDRHFESDWSMPAQPPTPNGRARHAGFDQLDYSKGVSEDGRIL